jgi:hypothetical protein
MLLIFSVANADLDEAIETVKLSLNGLGKIFTPLFSSKATFIIEVKVSFPLISTCLSDNKHSYFLHYDTENYNFYLYY